MLRILDLKKPRSGSVLGETKRGKSIYIRWHGKTEPDLLRIDKMENDLFMGEKRYLIKEFKEVGE